MPASVLVDVLRQASKACVVKRKFRKAELLIKQAVYLARDVFGCSHPKYSDSLLDYGFYLLNYDSIGHSVQVYQVCSYLLHQMLLFNDKCVNCICSDH